MMTKMAIAYLQNTNTDGFLWNWKLELKKEGGKRTLGKNWRDAGIWDPSAISLWEKEEMMHFSWWMKSEMGRV